MFEIDGGSYTLAELLSANRGDDELCHWAERAQTGDVFGGGAGGEVRCLLDWVSASIQRGRREEHARRLRQDAIGRANGDWDVGGCECGSQRVMSTGRKGSGAWRCMHCGAAFTEFAHGMSRFAAKQDEVAL